MTIETCMRRGFTTYRKAQKSLLAASKKCVYTIYNKGGSHLVPYIMGAFYSTWVTNTDALHMAQYYNVREEKILWINGQNQLQSEIVYPCQNERKNNLDCRTISQNQIPNLHAEALLAMQLLCEEEAFHIMD